MAWNVGETNSVKGCQLQRFLAMVNGNEINNIMITDKRFIN